MQKLLSYVRSLIGDDDTLRTNLKRDRDYSDDDPPVNKKYKTVKSNFPKVIMASDEDEWSLDPPRAGSSSRVHYIPIRREGFTSTSTPSVQVPSYSKPTHSSLNRSSTSKTMPQSVFSSNTSWKRPTNVFEKKRLSPDLSGISIEDPLSKINQMRKSLCEQGYSKSLQERLTRSSLINNLEIDDGDEEDEDDDVIYVEEERPRPREPRLFKSLRKLSINGKENDLSDSDEVDIICLKRVKANNKTIGSEAPRQYRAVEHEQQSNIQPRRFFKSRGYDSSKFSSRNSRESMESNGQFKAPRLLGRTISNSPCWKIHKRNTNYVKRNFSYGITSGLKVAAASPTGVADKTYRIADKKKFEELIKLCKVNYSRAAPAKPSTCNLSEVQSFLNKFTSSRTTLNNFSQRTSDILSKPKIASEVIDLDDKDDKSESVMASALCLSDSDNENAISIDGTSTSSVRIAPVNSLKISHLQKPVAKNDWYTELTSKYERIALGRKNEVNDCKFQTSLIGQLNQDQYKKKIENNLKTSMRLPIEIIDLEAEEEELPELTDEQEAIVNKALQRNPPNQVLIEKFNLSIHRRDIQSLAGLNWLNDEVINFYMNLIMDRSQNKNMLKVYGMNTFFYPKLMQSGHAGLKRWTRKVDIFLHDLLLVPVHLGVHWCMSIVDLKNKTVKYYDSMGGANMECCNALLKYLEDESMDKKKEKFNTSGWKKECVKDIPQQMNGSDCGMFACTFAEFFSRGASISFSQDDMPYLRRKMVLEIVSGQLLI